MKTITAILSVAASVILLVSCASADSPPPLPNTFYGELKFENSSGQFDAPEGTVLEAFIDNINKGSSVVLIAGKYSIDVHGTNNDDGKNISLRVNNMAVEKIAVFNANYPPPVTLNLMIKICCDIVPIPGMDNVPTDPDGDSLYEDINGNGRKDFNDVVMFFNFLEWIPYNEPISNFDFNGNSRIDFNDIVRLFEEL